jgi:quercetin dioxygenase-like cupin family protein
MANTEAITRISLLTAELLEIKKVARVEVKQINFNPLQKTGLHRHPCDVVGCVTKGSIRFQVEGKTSQILNEGDAFFEPANCNVKHFDNDSATEPATFIAFYLLGKDENKLIEMLE